MEGTACTAPVASIIACSSKCSCNSICTAEGSPIPYLPLVCSALRCPALPCPALPCPALPYPTLSLLSILFRFISLLFSSLQNFFESILDCKIQSECKFENIIHLSSPLLSSPPLPFSPVLPYPALYYRCIEHDPQRIYPCLSASKERNPFILHAHPLRCRDKP